MYVSSNSDRFPSNSKISTHILGKIEILSHHTLVVIFKLVELEYVSRKMTNTLHHLLMKAIVRCQTSIGCMNTSEDETGALNQDTNNKRKCDFKVDSVLNVTSK